MALSKQDIDALDMRFALKVVERGECWEWIGSTNRVGGGGYGILTVNGKPTVAHRYAWELVNGPIPKGMSVLHHCDNRPCVRPDHLFLCTMSDNMRDMVAKGRGMPPIKRGERSKYARLTEAQIREILLRKRNGESSRSIAKRFNTLDTSINRIVRRERWAHVPDGAE